MSKEEDDAEEAEDEKTYRIVRFYQDPNRDREVQATGLTRAEAVEHCRLPSTRGDNWFDGWEEE